MENSELITKALAYIRSEAGKSDMSIEDVASHAGFSTDYFNRIFAAHTGFNVMGYIRFRRLKKAMFLLRMTDRDILDIALECGYEAHESFSRAFKKQYGKTPTEYREAMQNTEMFYGDLYHDDTVGMRITHEFPQFKQATRDDAIDWILENDALRLGYEAICFVVNGGAALYDGDSLDDGFIWINEWPDRGFDVSICASDYDTIARYMNTFTDSRFNMCIFTLDDESTIREELAKRGVTISKVCRTPNRVYTGEPFELTAPDGITMKEVTYADMEAYENYWLSRGFNTRHLDYIKREFHRRDVLGCENHSIFQFFVYYGDKIIGLCIGGLQHAHDFVINNCIEISLCDEYKSDELYRYAYKYVTNAAMKRGAIPFDDSQILSNEHRNGNFDSTDLGYRTVTYCCTLNR